jgi:hypothetical protein
MKKVECERGKGKIGRGGGWREGLIEISVFEQEMN